MEKHNIAPVFDRNSRILILGSFPSVKSREAEFFYAHPQNRFWRVISRLLECECPVTAEEKRAMLINSGTAVWDVIESCDIEGSGDSTIKNVKVNRFDKILKTADIKRIFCNGAASYKLYHKYCEPQTGIGAVKLPSTSPANAAFSLERLIREWKVILEAL